MSRAICQEAVTVRAGRVVTGLGGTVLSHSWPWPGSVHGVLRGTVGLRRPFEVCSPTLLSRPQPQGRHYPLHPGVDRP